MRCSSRTRDNTMLTQRGNEYRVRYANTHVERIMAQFLGGILLGLLSVTSANGEVRNVASNHSGMSEMVVQGVSSPKDFSQRRDPFQPIQKRRAISSTPRKARSKPPQQQAMSSSIPTLKNPSWKLLGIIHGQNGRQAVIQISPQERVFVRSGLEVARSGWIIKAISKEEVLLEYSLTPRGGRSRPQAFILSFSALGQPS